MVTRCLVSYESGILPRVDKISEIKIFFQEHDEFGFPELRLLCFAQQANCGLSSYCYATLARRRMGGALEE